MTDPIIAAARFLGGHLDWLRHRSATEIQECFADIAAALNLSGPAWIAGSNTSRPGRCGPRIRTGSASRE